MTQTPTIIQSKLTGPYTFSTDSILHGMIEGDAHVRVGTSVTINGMITGDLIIDHGASAVVNGTVGGDVENGGRLQVAGVVGGDITSRSPAVTEVLSGSIVRGVTTP